MEDLKVNREYKSSIFAILFGSEEYKQNILDLYNALLIQITQILMI